MSNKIVAVIGPFATSNPEKYIKCGAFVIKGEPEMFFFNEDIVGYYIAAFDLSTGVSNVLMFDYAIETDDLNCYLPGDFISLTVDFEIKVQIPSIGINIIVLYFNY